MGHAYGVNHPSHSSFVIRAAASTEGVDTMPHHLHSSSVNHAAASAEGIDIMSHHAAMLEISGGSSKQASNSHTVLTVTAQLLTLPCICGVMSLTLEHSNVVT